MTGLRVLSVVGARPNFMKLAPVARALGARGAVDHVVVHTGQHYDDGMSAAFFRDLGMPEPGVNLGVGSGSHAQQTATIMQRIEPVLLDVAPDLVLVYGDVNSTVAAALVAAKLGVRLGHVEAGVRSHDWSMPEEVNRVVTDRLADLLFTPTRDAEPNLRAEGVPADRIHFVGNTMLDEVLRRLPAARALETGRRLGLPEAPYVVVTLHRAGTVDDGPRLAGLLEALATIAREATVVFPVHPRTRGRMREHGLESVAAGCRLLEPLGYLEMLGLVDGAAAVITDSGGLQAETGFLGVPCVTARTTTEWTVTVERGLNRLVPPEGSAVLEATRAALRGGRRPAASIEGWDGHAAERLVDVMLERET